MKTQRLPLHLCAAFVCSLAIALASGCKEDGQRGSAEGATEAAAKPSHPDVTSSEARTLGIRLAGALSKPCDPQQVLRLVDSKAMFSAVVAKHGGGSTRAEKLALGFWTGVCGQITRSFDDISVLRPHRVGAEQRVLLRATGVDGFNYLDVSVSRVRGLVRAHELYSYQMGQPFSALLTRLYGAASGADGGYENPELERQMQKLSEHEANGDHAEARAVIASLPSAVRDSKLTRLKDLVLAAEGTDADFESALTDFTKRFPDDGALPFFRLAHHAVREEYGQAVQAIEALDQMVQGDPYLAYLRAKFLRLDKKDVEAKAWLLKALKEEPLLKDAHWESLDMANESKDFPAVADRLLTLRDTLKEPVSIWKTDPRFADFRASADAARLK